MGRAFVGEGYRVLMPSQYFKECSTCFKEGFQHANPQVLVLQIIQCLMINDMSPEKASDCCHIIPTRKGN